MAKIEKVKQSVFGRTLGAELRAAKVRPVDMAAPLERGLSRFVQGATSLVNTFSRLKEEEANAALEQAQADYLQEVTEGLNKEVYSLHGEALHGAEDRARKIQLDALNRQREKLSRYGAEAGRRFSLFAQRNSTGETSRVVHYAAGEIRRSTLDAAQRTQSSSLRNFSMSGDDFSREAYLESFDRAWGVANGRIITDDKLRVLKEDEEAGFVRIGNEKLRIVDEIKEGDKGVISRDKADDLLARFTQENAAYNQAHREAVDNLHTARINQLLKWGDVVGAKAYLEQRTNEKGAVLSGRARTALSSLIGKNYMQIKVGLEAGVWMNGLLKGIGKSDSKSMGGQLYTPEFERQGLAAISRQTELAGIDATGEARARLNAMTSQFNQRLQVMRAFTRSETERITNYLSGGNPSGTNYFVSGKEPELIEELNKLPDSYIKDKLMADALRRRAIADAKLADTPEARRMREARIMEFMRLMSEGTPVAIRYPGDPEGGLMKFDLSKKDQADRALDYFGFTAREKQRIHASLQDPFPLRIVTGLISDGLNDALGLSPDDPKRFTPGAVSYMAPELVERMRKLLSYDTRVADSARAKGALTKDEEKTLRTKVKTLLQSYAVKEPGKLWGFNDVSLPEFLYRGLGENGNLDAEFFYDKFTDLAMSDDQLRAVERAAQEYRLSVNPRKPNETDAEITSTRRSPSTVQTTQAQRRSGRVRDPETGLYYKRSVLDKEGKRREERRKSLDKHFNPSLSETYGIGKR